MLDVMDRQVWEQKGRSEHLNWFSTRENRDCSRKQLINKIQIRCLQLDRTNAQRDKKAVMLKDIYQKKKTHVDAESGHGVRVTSRQEAPAVFCVQKSCVRKDDMSYLQIFVTKNQTQVTKGLVLIRLMTFQCGNESQIYSRQKIYHVIFSQKIVDSTLLMVVNSLPDKRKTTLSSVYLK